MVYNQINASRLLHAALPHFLKRSNEAQHHLEASGEHNVPRHYTLSPPALHEIIIVNLVSLLEAESVKSEMKKAKVLEWVVGIAGENVAFGSFCHLTTKLP
nr:expressed protein [Hymenolepis microstoma]